MEKKEMLKIEKLTKYYGDLLAVSELSLEVFEGEVFGFIGPNGAGKSTTLRCIMNLINKNSGKIYVLGEKDYKDNTDIISQIGYLPSGINLYNNFTVSEMIEYNNTFYSANINKRAKELVKRFKLDTSKKISELSFGNLKKLGIVLAFAHSPKILILDEATNGLDPLMQDELIKLIREVKQSGVTILYSTHNLSEIKKICDRVALIKDGKIIKISKTIEINEDKMLDVKVYGDVSRLKVFDKIISKEENFIRFMYNGDVNELLSILSKVKIDKLTIEELDIENVFKHYYE